jgi:hypothetical protein
MREGTHGGTGTGLAERGPSNEDRRTHGARFPGDWLGARGGIRGLGTLCLLDATLLRGCVAGWLQLAGSRLN